MINHALFFCLQKKVNEVYQILQCRIGQDDINPHFYNLVT